VPRGSFFTGLQHRLKNPASEPQPFSPNALSFRFPIGMFPLWGFPYWDFPFGITVSVLVSEKGIWVQRALAHSPTQAFIYQKKLGIGNTYSQGG
jgi:hypothetical protein